MKRKLFRKLCNAHLIGCFRTPVFYPPVDVSHAELQISDNITHHIRQTANISFSKRFHRKQFKSKMEKGLTQMSGTTSKRIISNYSKDKIISMNQFLLSVRLFQQSHKREAHICELLEQQAFLHLCVKFKPFDLITEEELKQLAILLKKTERSSFDAIWNYQIFMQNNSNSLIFGELAPATAVPDNQLITHVTTHKHDNHRFSKNKKKRISQYRKKARQNKQLEREFFMREWIDCDSHFEDDFDDDFGNAFDGHAFTDEFGDIFDGEFDDGM